MTKIASTTVSANAEVESPNNCVVENEEVLNLLECAVCLDHITPPIRQCLIGHLFCSDCFPRLTQCPTCRGSMSTERNLAMEQVSNLLKYPCRYYPMGCKSVVTLGKKADHENECRFLQFKCPFHGQCAFNGALDDVLPHLTSEHNVCPVPVKPEGRLFYRAKNFHRRNVWTLVFQWETHLFRFIVRHVNSSTVGRNDNTNLIIAHIQLVGPDSVASNYSYQVSIFNTETRKTSRKFSAPVTSILKPIESQCSKDEIFVNSFNHVRHYTDPWSNLNFIIHIMNKNKKGKRHSSEYSGSGKCKGESDCSSSKRSKTRHSPRPSSSYHGGGVVAGSSHSLLESGTASVS